MTSKEGLVICRNFTGDWEGDQEGSCGVARDWRIRGADCSCIKRDRVDFTRYHPPIPGVTDTVGMDFGKAFDSYGEDRRNVANSRCPHVSGDAVLGRTTVKINRRTVTVLDALQARVEKQIAKVRPLIDSDVDSKY